MGGWGRYPRAPPLCMNPWNQLIATLFSFQIETVETMKQIEKDTAIAEETKVVVTKEEKEATIKAETTQAIADDAKKDLDEALPMLDAALASLKSLNKSDVTEVGVVSIAPVYITVEPPLYKGQAGGGSFVPYTVEPLYKGQVGNGSFAPYTVEPLYKGQVGNGSFAPYTVEPLYKGQVGKGSFIS